MRCAYPAYGVHLVSEPSLTDGRVGRNQSQGVSPARCRLQLLRSKMVTRQINALHAFRSRQLPFPGKELGETEGILI